MRIVIALAALVVLAGCASDPKEEKDDFEVPVEVDDTTGAIRGVVVDASITPIADVTVRLLSDPPQEQMTDEQGRFAFSKLAPGFYMLNASKPLFTSVQLQTTVEAGDADPGVVRMQLTRLFSGEPYVSSYQADGFFTCSQAGMPPYFYSSSSCHDTFWVDGSDYGITLDQERDFHQDVADGWQTLVFEMTWTPSAQGTSDRMGMVVSTYKPERPTNHYFADVESGSPMRIQLDVGESGPGAQQGDGESDRIPAEGIQQMSFFASVRPPADAVCPLWCVPPGLALDQSFDVYLHQFNYLPAPDGWSIVNGDTPPF